LVGEYRSGQIVMTRDLGLAIPRSGDEHDTDQHEQLVSAARPYYLQDKSQERTAKLPGVSGPTVSGLLEGESPIDAESGV
jgi:hypothetical protein